MATKPCSTVALAIIIALLTAFPVATSHAGSLSGIVLDNNGDPVVDSGAVISASDTANSGYSWTDSNGEYLITDLGPGTYQVNAYFPATGLTLEHYGVIIGIGNTVVDFTLNTKGSFVGATTDTLGLPLAGVEIVAVDKVLDSGVVIGSVHTDESGMYEIHGLDSGVYQITLLAIPITLRYDSAYTSDGQTQVIDFHLDQGVSISGTVSYETGDPVYQASIGAYRTEPEGAPGFSRAGRTTESDGWYSVSGLSEGVYTLYLSWPENERLRYSGLSTVDGGDYTVDFDLGTGGVIAGTVYDPFGDPIGYPFVEATRTSPVDEPGYDYGAEFANGTGYYVIEGLSDGEYTVCVETMDYGIICVHGQIVSSGDTTFVDFIDTDDDGILDPEDNCPFYFNPDQDPPCGDCTVDCTADIDDVVFLLSYIFAGGPEPAPYRVGDVDCSGDIDIDDAVYQIAYIFSGGPHPCQDCPPPIAY
jgi:hypothetical protein